MDMPEFLRFDEREDAINALEHAAETVLTVETNPANWKWIIIALHNALQGTLVCTISGTANVGALDKKSMRKMMDWLEDTRTNCNAPMPRERLADLITLYQRAMIPDYMQEFGGSPIDASLQKYGDVRKLHELRCDFVHFTPRGWSVESAGLPRIALSVTAIIETLMLSHPACTFRLNTKQAKRVRKAIAMLREAFPNMEPAKEMG